MNDRVTVYEAAKLLGVSEGAVRQRIHRGKLQTDKDDTGRVYVHLTRDDLSNYPVKTSVTDSAGADQGLLDELRDRIRFLEEELTDRKEESRRKDTIIAQMNQTLSQLTQRVPELEAAAEPRESAVIASGEKGEVDVPQEQTEDETRQSWWRRWFGG